MASSRFLYITKGNYVDLLTDLNIDSLADTKQNELLDRAVGEMESDLVERFVVPLEALSGPFSTSPDYSRQKVLSTLKSKIRQIIGGDQQKNLTVDSTETGP